MNEELLKVIVEDQANDPALWSFPRSITEDSLQKALRRLHVAIEGKTQLECAIEALTKDWEKSSES